MGNQRALKVDEYLIDRRSYMGLYNKYEYIQQRGSMDKRGSGN